MLELVSFLRTLAFAALYAGIEYRYVNRRDEEWTRTMQGFFEKPAFWKISPYQAYLLFPVFVVVSYTMPLSAWAGNLLLVVTLEDILYFVWRGRWVAPGEWTTTLFGKFTVGGRTVPAWWIPGALLVVILYWVPV